MKASTLAIVLLIAIAIGVACGPKTPPGPPKADEITALWTQIREWRRQAKLPVDPRHEDVISATPMSFKQIEAICAAQQPPACDDVCSLADNICDNAEQICILADELGKDDEWAQDKCNNAKASCRDAKKRCCDCGEKQRKAAANGW